MTYLIGGIRHNGARGLESLLPRLGLLLAVAAGIGGCAPHALSGHDSGEIQQYGWAFADPPPLFGVYCYETLAEADCYDQPQPGRANQRLGHWPMLTP